MDAETPEWARKVRRRAYFLFGTSVVFYFFAYLNPFGTDFTQRFYLSVAAGLFTASLVLPVTAELTRRPSG